MPDLRKRVTELCAKSCRPPCGPSNELLVLGGMMGLQCAMALAMAVVLSRDVPCLAVRYRSLTLMLGLHSRYADADAFRCVAWNQFFHCSRQRTGKA